MNNENTITIDGKVYKYEDLGSRKEPASRKKYETKILSTGEVWTYEKEMAQGLTKRLNKRG